MVGRNVAIDDIRRSRKLKPLPEDEAISDLDDAEEQTSCVCRRATSIWCAPARRSTG